MDPLAEDSGEFTRLDIDPGFGEGGVAEEIFVEAGGAVGFGEGIEAAVPADLDETVEMVAEAGVEVEGEARVDGLGVAAEEEAGGAAAGGIEFEGGEDAEVGAEGAVAGGEEERVVEAVEPGGVGAGGGGDEEEENGE